MKASDLRILLAWNRFDWRKMLEVVKTNKRFIEKLKEKAVTIWKSFVPQISNNVELSSTFVLCTSFCTFVGVHFRKILWVEKIKWDIPLKHFAEMKYKTASNYTSRMWKYTAIQSIKSIHLIIPCNILTRLKL